MERVWKAAINRPYEMPGSTGCRSIARGRTELFTGVRITGGAVVRAFGRDHERRGTRAAEAKETKDADPNAAGEAYGVTETAPYLTCAL
jgi:hypothetical protein